MADSHEVLPLALSDDAQREADLLPFREAVAAGVPMVMTAHLAVPAWDDHPATLSPVALQHWLRRRLGFEGVTITDDLEMGGISTKLPAPQGAQEALAAGADLLLICNNWQAAWETARLLGKDASRATRGREAAARLNSLRQSLRAGPGELKAVKEYFARQS
jgi:beta-glucosidase-like glycosyl hydrolase